ncbi:MAG: asparagine synthase (glutamine-hydrolyzing) [Gemmataceae bacterium]|nr:asparagine synthase (glutamine-hydrolyzing) [Gemmataceae bacterium]MCI0743436.1 asparagine synthase (glutamine-hydrolyzing) [Gemmataceae bacterium]
MCGIAGIVSLSGLASFDPGTVRAMADALYHRGPDEDGYFHRPGLALASRRLSIVGLLDGRQPIHNEDETISVVFNGEFFDYPEVRADLERRGHRFRTHCDTEILPHLYEDNGDALLPKLRGQFAFALWDQRKRRLLLARDRFGICPLYWTRQRTAHGEILLFASEIKSLLASGLVVPRPDPRGINHAFTFFALPGPVTCFQGIELLLPGHYLSIKLGHGNEPARVTQNVYWEMDFPDRGDEEWRDFRRFASNAKSPVVDEFEQLLMKSVERRLRADVPVVSYLSGGVDSSVVVALATHLRKQNGERSIPTFTVSVQDPKLNERNEADLVAQHIGARTVLVDCGREEVLQSYPELIRAAEGPVIDTSCAALLMLARKVHSDGYKVALTGEGADEWLAGYPWYKIQKLLGMLDVIPGIELSQVARRAYLRLTGSPRFSWATTRRVQQAIGGPNAWLNIYGLFSSAKLRFFSQGMWDQLGDHLAYADLQLNVERARRWHPLNRSLYLGARVMLPGLLLLGKGDRVAMNSSVETRYPFLDEDIFDFLAKLHPHWKMRGLRDKLILRYVAARWLPRSIAWRRKAMFRAPLDGFHTARLPTFVDELLSPESLKKTGYFEPSAVLHWRNEFRNLREGANQRTMVEMGLVGVVATQLWHHTFIDSGLASLPSLAQYRPRQWDGAPVCTRSVEAGVSTQSVATRST